MQAEIDTEFPELPITILGCNEFGEESENDIATQDVDLPWLQDIDDDTDGESDAWLEWNTTLRDYVIVDRNNVELFRLSLTTNSLSIPANYERVKQMMVQASQFTIRGDLNRDSVVDLLDITPMVDAITSGTFQFEGDLNNDGLLDLQDVQPFVKLLTGN